MTFATTRPLEPVPGRKPTIRAWKSRAGALFWCSNGPAAESDERYLGNVGLHMFALIEWAGRKRRSSSQIFAIESLGELGPMAEAALPVLRNLESDPELQEHVQRAISRIQTNERNDESESTQQNARE